MSKVSYSEIYENAVDGNTDSVVLFFVLLMCVVFVLFLCF